MRRVYNFIFLLCILMVPSLLHAQYSKLQGWCEDGNIAITIPGTQGSGAQKFNRSYPSCTVTVFTAGTVSVATIYSDTTGTVKANPFTAASSGQWFFYGLPGAQYDVKFSNGGIAIPFTLGAQTTPLPTSIDGTFTGGNIVTQDSVLGYNTALGIGVIPIQVAGMGYRSTAIGWHTLNQNTTGPFNTAIGDSALSSNISGPSNVAVGASALLSNTTGGSHVAVGLGALRTNTTGNNNTAVGKDALDFNITGHDMVGVGVNAGTNALGNYNVFIGSQAGSGDAAGASGGNNVAVGRNALFAYANGSDNVAIGLQSGDGLTSGTQNTFIGESSCRSIVAGTNNVCVGFQSGPASDLTNTIAIGELSVPTASNQAVVGNPSITTTVLYGSVGVNIPPNTSVRMMINDNAAKTEPSISGLTPIAHLISGAASAETWLWDSFGTNNSITMRRADGTLASPSAVQSGETLGHIGGAGYGTAYTTIRAALDFVTTEIWTATNQGTRATGYGTPNGSTSPVLTFAFDGVGIFGNGVTVGNAPSTLTANYLSLGTVAVGSLPAAGATNAGQIIYVSNSTAIAAEGQVCAAGGAAVTALAFSNGTNWKCF